MRYTIDLLVENEKYLSEQIITYIGNKRSLLGFINEAIEWIINDSGKESFVIADMFSGSGIVSRFFKRYSSNLIVNDLEGYSYTLNQCYLSNVKSVELNKLKK